jgi:hypothetical protein
MASYKNALFDFAHSRPVLSFFVVPIGINLVAGYMQGIIRTAKTGSPFLGVGAGEEDSRPVNPLGATKLRAEGGEPSDLMFRATISDRPTGPGTAVGDEIQPRPSGAPVRYDRAYHDEGFLPKIGFKDTRATYAAPRSSKVEDSYVFAGMNGLSKLR